MVLKVGCCGFPVGRREYFLRFPMGEIQQTFNNLFMGEDALRFLQRLGQMTNEQ